MQSFSLYEKSAGSSNLTNLLSIENTERNHSLEASRDNDDDVADDIAEEQDYHGETVLIQEEKHELANTTLLPNSTSVNLKDLEAESPHQPIWGKVTIKIYNTLHLSKGIVLLLYKYWRIWLALEN